MAGSIFRKLGFSKQEESSSDSEEETRNDFIAPSDSPDTELVFSNPRPQSVFSEQTRSSITGGSRNTRITDGTADTSASLRTEASKRQRLQVVDVDSGQNHHVDSIPKSFEELLTTLQTLASKFEALDSQTNIDTASRVSATLARLLNDYTEIIEATQFPIDSDRIPDEFISKLLRVVLGFSDVYLAEQTHRSARAHLLKALYSIGSALNLINSPEEDQDSAGFGFGFGMGLGLGLDGAAVTIPQPRLFAIGSTQRPVPNENLLMMVLESFAAGNVPITEQEGAYVAPVLCGLSPRFSVATLCLGIPDMQKHHYDAIVALRSELRSLHVYGRRDAILPAAVSSQPRYGAQVKPPYRIPTDPMAPPMSISLATTNAAFVSGTLGGFVYPKVPNSATMDRNVYALTCGHVCLQNGDDGQQQQQAQDEKTKPPPTVVEYPSPVLRRLFRKALVLQKDKFSPESTQRKALEEGITRVDGEPQNILGEVVWGERCVINHQMSDTAVIKCEPTVDCQNWLGDDIELSQYDPSLILDQLHVRSIVDKSRGLEIFKYGSTSRYTSGIVSNIRIAYWANGTMQTSEFAVRAGDSPSFANGGDSGAWILSSTSNGLGVVGMLHSYDGEFKEFGLYTPMQTILSRLHDVTGVPWGVLGVPSDSDVLAEEGENSE